MTTVTAKVLIAPKQAENTQTAQYTATDVVTLIDKFTATNTSAATATLSVNLVTSGDSAGDENLIVKTRSIAAGETYIFPEIVGQVLEDGDYLSTIASASSSITIRCSGREIS